MHPVFHFACEVAVAVLAPPRCAACDANVRLLQAFCNLCAASVERIVSNVESGVAAYAYGGAIGSAIAKLKYERRPDLARPLADLLWRALLPFARTLADPLVVPVPLHVSRLAERGYNQSALLGGRLASRLRAPHRPLALRRTRETAQQASLDREGRRRNVAGAFLARKPNQIEGRTIILVDDVRTTGATLDACQAALVAAGAKKVVWATVARAG